MKTFKDKYLKSAQLWNKPVVLAGLFNEDEEPVSNKNSLLIIDVYTHYRRLLILTLILKLFSSFFHMWAIIYGIVTLRQCLQGEQF